MSARLFPPLKPWYHSHVEVGDGHRLYVEQSGCEDGWPVVVVHGGPGGGCAPSMRQYFDPSRWRIILFDQRGAGLSTPMGGLEHNHTDALVSDMECLRQQLGIERWALFGGSWGVTLSLRYAQCHPERVAALVLRGVFLCRPQDLDWLYGGGAGRLQPEAWQAFNGPIPPAQRDDLVAAYLQRLTDPEVPETEQLLLAQAWAAWEATCATLLPSAEVSEGFQQRALALARLEAHYFRHGGFLPADGLLAGCAALPQWPVEIVHGRYDLVCPLDQAWALHQALPHSRLTVVADGGHASSEPGIQQALLDAVMRVGAQLESLQ